MNLRTMWALCKKDAIDMSRNGVLIFLFMIPISLSWFYGTVLSSGDLKPPLVVLFDTDGASAFAAFVKSSKVFELVASPDSWDEARDMVQQGQVRGAILLPAGFDAALAQQQSQPAVVLYLDAANRTTSAIIQEGVRGLLRAHVGQELPANIELQQVRGLTVRQTNIPVWMTIAILLAGINMVPTLLVEEKDKKTLDAILVTMTPQSEIIWGKCLVGLIMALVMALIILLLNRGFIGNLPSLFVVLALGAVSFVLTGLFIGSLAQSVQMASLISSLALLPLVLVATLTDISPIVSAASRFLPSFYLLDGIERAMFLGSSLSALWLHALVLAIFGGLAFAGSLLALRRKEA